MVILVFLDSFLRVSDAGGQDIIFLVLRIAQLRAFRPRMIRFRFLNLMNASVQLIQFLQQDLSLLFGLDQELVLLGLVE